MRTAGVLFDLFGTLVAPFRRQEHTQVIRECSDLLAIDFDDCHRRWAELLPQRVRGDFGSVADCFAYIAHQAGSQATPDALARAETAYEHFTLPSLEPIAGTLEVLAHLQASGLRLGLVSNCGPDVPRLWGRSRFAPYFSTCAFSCEVGAAKPSPEIYRTALEALKLRPDETFYVGDGSDQELSGAARCGLQVVLKNVDLSNTYDPQRSDVDHWSGPTIHALAELPGLLAAARPSGGGQQLSD